jgi:hypothetical protein
MDLGRLAALKAELRRCGWWDSARQLGRATRTSSERTADLLVVGTPVEEPWHLVAHLADAARLRGATMPEPTLVRWRVPAGAPAHLSVGLDRLADVRRSTLLVVAPDAAPAGLLQRVSDARNRGATVLALGEEGELAALAHEAVLLPSANSVELDLAGHVVGAEVASGAPLVPAPRRSLAWRRRTLR